MKQKEDPSRAPVSKRVLFVCKENAIQGVMAEGIFNHMGPNMARGWIADSAGTRVRFEGGPVDNRTSKILKLYAVPDPGKTTRQFHPALSSQFGTILCSDQAVLEQVRQTVGEDTLPQVLLLGDFHKRGSVEIMDPTKSKDSNAFDKCYWLIYYSVQGFLKKIKEEAQQKEPKPINKVVKKPHIEDTINQTSKLKDIFPKLIIDPSPIFYLEVPLKTINLVLTATLSPPQAPTNDILDVANSPPRPMQRVQTCDVDQDIKIVGVTKTIERQRFSFSLSPPQAPTVDSDDITNYTKKIEKLFWHEKLSDDHGPQYLLLNNLQPPKCYYLFPPLHYVVDLDGFHLSPLPCPPSLLEDNDNRVVRKKEKVFFLETIVQPIVTDVLVQPPTIPPTSPPCTTLSLSPPSPPFLPSYPPKDLIVYPPKVVPKTPEICAHTPVLWSPAFPATLTVLIAIFSLTPPQLAEYPNIADFPNSPHKHSNRIPDTENSNQIFLRRPLRSPSIPRYPPVEHISPPQAPELPDRRVSRGEDLFDQVRRSSRAFNTFSA